MRRSAQILALVRELEASLSLHRLKILNLPEDASRSDMLTRVKAIETHIYGLRQTLYPPVLTASIHSLPNELLRYIFEVAHAQHCPDGVTLAAKLSSVCRIWRAIMLSTPALWSAIEMDWDDETSRKQMRLGFKLSKSTPVDLVCSFGYADEGEHEETDEDRARIETVLHGITTHCARIKSLQIYIQTDGQRESVGEAFRDLHMPLLERFHLQLTYIPSRDDIMIPDYEPATIFEGGAPLLRSVTLEGCGFIYCETPLTTVTTLVIEDPNFWMELDYETLAEIMNSATALESLTIVGEMSPLSARFSGPDILHPTLKHLRVDRWTFLVANCIVAPALDSLHIHSASVQPFAEFIRLVTESPTPRYPALLTLNLGDVVFHDVEKWKALIRSTPTVLHLHTRVDDEEKSLGILDIVAGTPDAWPQLESVTAPGMHKHTLVHLVRSRMQQEMRGPFRRLVVKEGFARAVRRDYPAVASWIGECGVEMVGRRGTTSWGHNREWTSFMHSWEDGSAESILGAVHRPW